MPVVMLISGGLLTVLALLTVQANAPEARLRLVPLVLAGLGLFGWGAWGAKSAENAPSSPAPHPPRLPALFARFFRISPAQALLLLAAIPLALLVRPAAGDGMIARHAGAATSAWLAAITALMVGGWQFNRQPRHPLRQRLRTNAWTLIAVAALLILALALRLHALESVPTTLSGDEASAALHALHFLRGEADNLFTVGWYSFPALSFAVNGVGLALFGQTITGVRVVSALAGSVTVVALWWLGREISGNRLGLIAAALLAGNHAHIHFSRLGLQNIHDGLFATAMLAALVAGWRREWRGGFLLAGLFLGLGHYFYITFRALPLVLLAWALLIALVDWAAFRRRWPDLLLAAGVAAMTYLPLGQYFLARPDEFNAPLRRVAVGMPSAEQWLRQMAGTAGGLTHLPSRDWYAVGEGLLLPVSAALLLLGLVWIGLRFHRFWLLIALTMLPVIVAGGFSISPPAAQRMVLLLPLAVLISAVPLAEIGSLIARQIPRQKGAVGLITVLIVAGIVVSNSTFYFGEAQKRYVMGGFNTQTATILGHWLQKEPEQSIYFLGFPRMGYTSINSVPFLAPQHRGHDLVEPLHAPPVDLPERPTLFLFLPERLDELPLVQAAWPGGSVEKVSRSADNQLYFVAYRLPPPPQGVSP